MSIPIVSKTRHINPFNVGNRFLFTANGDEENSYFAVFEIITQKEFNDNDDRSPSCVDIVAYFRVIEESITDRYSSQYEWDTVEDIINSGYYTAVDKNFTLDNR